MQSVKSVDASGLGDEIEVTEAGGHRERDEEAEGDGEQLSSSAEPRGSR